MTDKELLEKAAKAAGIDLAWHTYEWNPLKDDGDALRLAVKLKIDLQFLETRILTWFPETDEIEEMFNNDPYAATRRAVVRAAAEIGKEIK